LFRYTQVIDLIISQTGDWISSLLITKIKRSRKRIFSTTPTQFCTILPTEKNTSLILKREFPSALPFYENFRQWADWGKALMELHINYEQVEPYKLEIIESGTKAESKRQKEFFSMVKEPETLYGYKPSVKAKLRADKETGIIEIDELTFLKGVPKSAWDYKLGNRSALEWVLDQYKEKKPSDPTIAEKFNTYRFADYKDHVIDLLKRVCTVSVETVKIVESMGKGKIDN
jgi:predicted helicase